MKSYYVLVLILTCVCAVFDTDTTCPFETPSIFVLARKVSHCTAGEIENYFGLRIVEILRKVRSLHDAFQNFEKSISLTRFDDIFPQSRHFDKLLENMQDVGDIFGTLLEYSIDGGDSVDNVILTDINLTVTSQRIEMERHTKKIYEHVSHTNRSLGRLTNWLAENTFAQDEIVRRTQQSPQQWLYNLYGQVVLAQLKGLVVVQLSSTVKIIMGVQIDKSRFRNTINEFQKRLNTIIKQLKMASRELSGDYWRFDPKEYKKDENYLEITRLLQGYLVNEKVLSNGRKCFGECNMFMETNILACQNDAYCRMQRQCNGYVYDCRAMLAMDMTVCPASHDSTRRYEYIQYADRSVLGKISSCSVSTATLSGWIGSCPYCMCFCNDEGHYSDRYISLKHAISDTAANKVVTGVRFVKKDRIIHLQVQQGELLPYGLVNDTTVEWVPVNSFKITDRYVHDNADYFKLGRMKNAIDLHVKEVEGGNKEYPKRLITGLRFSILKMKLGMHLNLEIRETAFDFNTGKLFLTSNQWTRNTQTTFSGRTQIHIDNVDLPTRSTTENTVQSHGVRYVEFTQTSLEKDAAQTTVPFIDAQDVAPLVPTPLIGAGVYYKGAEGYGGFIGLKIVTCDFTEHL